MAVVKREDVARIKASRCGEGGRDVTRAETKRGKSVAVVEREDAVNSGEAQPAEARVEAAEVAGEAAAAGAVTAEVRRRWLG